MLRTHLASLLVFVLAAGVSSAADDTYLLRLYKEKQGDRSENEKSEVSKNIISVSVMGMDQKQEISGGKKEAYVEEILEKKPGERNATKLRRTYKTAEKTERGETEKAVYAGQTVLIERKNGGKLAISIKGKELEKSEAPDLFKSLEKSDDEPRNEDLLPQHAVKVGETWKVPGEKSEKMFKSLGEEKMKIDVKKSNVSGKLLKVYKKDGAQFGVLELTIEVFVTEIDVGGEFAKTKEGSKMSFKATIDTCIDGSVKLEESKMSATIDITANLPGNGSLTLAGTVTGNAKSRALK